MAPQIIKTDHNKVTIFCLSQSSKTITIKYCENYYKKLRNFS